MIINGLKITLQLKNTESLNYLSFKQGVADKIETKLKNYCSDI